MCMPVTIGEYVHVSTVVHKTELDALELELLVGVGNPTNFFY